MATRPRLQDFHDADGREIQPYYAAYMITHNLDRPLTGSQWPFMAWIQKMWRESGVNREPADHAGFLAWLEAEVAS